MSEETTTPAIDRRRYTRITRFFGGVIFSFIFWDVVLGRIPVVRRYVRRSRTERYRKQSRRFRELAVNMGGVMIKLGQFLSARVDILPKEVTDELKGLQDEVPPVPLDQIRAAIYAELGDPALSFAEVETEPMAAASLGQTHRAWLLPDEDEDGNPVSQRGAAVVIKVQRPDIETVVTTDLEALRVVARWIMKYRPIGRRANVPALMEEFAVTLWEELDYMLEADNAARFRAMFAHDQGVNIPEFYPDLCTSRVLVMENVESIKITDVEGMTSAGIDPKIVADKLLEVYFRQIFEEAYFHADPHPGNLFVRPLGPDPAAAVVEVEEGVDSAETETPPAPRPFQIVFVDFGMVGRIEALRARLRKVLVAVTQRDAYTLTQAYQELGFFLPGADLERINIANARLLDQIWGRNLLDLSRPDPREVQELTLEFRDLLFEFPFQVPQDFIYLGRAVGMLSGLVSQLNPEINPWYHIEKYGEKVIRSEEGRQLTRDVITETFRRYARVPAQLQQFLDSAEAGRLQIRTIQDEQTRKRLDRLERRVSQLNSTVLAAALLISGTLLYLNGATMLGYLAWGATAAFVFWSLFRARG
ncbi:MAG: AarF/UbiB family protein [Anaerolineae bacterium]|nr:AarF/UbiB family protein [Anaerolineae bacterium]